MVTVITVHGTGYAVRNGAWFRVKPPRDGAQRDDWIYESSTFAEKVKKSSGAAVEWTTFSWGKSGRGGQNSHLQREAAGKALFKALKQEFAGDKVILIGHSHGGNVILSALRRAAYLGDDLNNLRMAILVGTPLLTFTREFRLRPKGWMKRAAIFFFIIAALAALKSQTLSVNAFCLIIGLGVVALMFTNYLFNNLFIPRHIELALQWEAAAKKGKSYERFLRENSKANRFAEAAASLNKRLAHIFHGDDEALKQLRLFLSKDILIKERAPGDRDYFSRIFAYAITLTLSFMMIALFAADSFADVKFRGVEYLRDSYNSLADRLGEIQDMAPQSVFVVVVLLLMSAFLSILWSLNWVLAKVFVGRALGRGATALLRRWSLGDDVEGYQVGLTFDEEASGETRLRGLKVASDSGMNQAVLAEVEKLEAQFNAQLTPDEEPKKSADDDYAVVVRASQISFQLPETRQLNVFDFADEVFQSFRKSIDFVHNKYFSLESFPDFVGEFVKAANETASKEDFLERVSQDLSARADERTARRRSWPEPATGDLSAAE